MKDITLNWNPVSPLRFEGADERGNNLVLDGTLAHGGEEKGFSPKTLLLLALGGCTGMDVISILRKMRQDVTGYSLEIKGLEEDEHPKKFERIVVEHVVTGRKLNKAMVDKAINLSHHKYCGVSASLEGSVHIEMTSRLVELGPEFS